jgi:hypothetical protein
MRASLARAPLPSRAVAAAGDGGSVTGNMHSYAAVLLAAARRAPIAAVAPAACRDWLSALASDVSVTALARTPAAAMLAETSWITSAPAPQRASPTRRVL